MELLRQSECNVYVCTVCPRQDGNVTPINDVIKRTCSETGAILLDVHSAFVYGNGSLVQHFFLRDGIHLSDVDQTKLIECIALSVKIVNRSPASPSNSIPAEYVDRRLDTQRQSNDRISPANNNARDVFRNNTIHQHHYGGPTFAETMNRGPRVYSVDETSNDAPHRQHYAEVPPRPNQDDDVYWNRYPRRQQYYGPPLPGSPRGDFRARGPQRLHHYGTYIGRNPNDDPRTHGPRYQHYRGASSTGFHNDVNGFRDQRRQPYRPTGENKHLYQNGNGRKWHY